jgi:riboflavin synthase
MFTGLIEAVGMLRARTARADGARIVVEAPFCGELSAGESVSVNGACLTAVEAAPRTFTAQVVASTLDRTTLGSLPHGAPVNLERALRIGDRLGGHFVAGHVDARGRIAAVSPTAAGRVVTVQRPQEMGRYVVPRGSIAVDGISLTVASLEDDTFTVSLIPETLERTVAGTWRAGAAVNLEADLLAKHIEALLQGRPDGSAASPGRQPDGGLTQERLQALGFLSRKDR